VEKNRSGIWIYHIELNHGWNIDGTIDYVDEAYPAVITELLLTAKDIEE
jgi:hypothetical protein